MPAPVIIAAKALSESQKHVKKIVPGGWWTIISAALTIIILLLVSAVIYIGGIAQTYMGIAQAPPCSDQSGGLITGPGGIGGTGFNSTFPLPEQKANAQAIIDVAGERKLPKRAAIIALATAMQESTLKNIQYGDLAGPDSRGLFQQRDPWGPLSVRMDPKGAAGLFYDRLVKVPNYLSIPLTQAAQSVQISAFPDAYAKWETTATEIAGSLTPASGGYGKDDGSEVTGGQPGSNGGPAVTPSTCQQGVGGTGGTGVNPVDKGDTYPYPQGSTSGVDPWGYYLRQCTSYVAWMMNIQMGWKPGQPYLFSAATVGLLGNADTWAERLAARGYKVDNTPAVGAIAWWKPYAGAGSSLIAGSLGHVAVVSAVYPDGGIDVQQYNAIPYTYSAQRIPASSVSGFIHVADVKS